MGTRHLICIWSKNACVLAHYGQWDGAPKGQGVRIFEFLKKPKNIERLRKGVKHLYKASEKELRDMDQKAHEEEKRRLAADPNFVPWDPKTNVVNELYPSISRDIGAGILDVIAKTQKKLPTINKVRFALDILFCEYVYVLDLDSSVLECYHGGDSSHRSDHRFSHWAKDDQELPRLISQIDFAELVKLKTDEDFLLRIRADRRELEDSDSDSDDRMDVDN